jgi:LacI family transcriptional regulator
LHRFTTIKDIARELNISVATVSRAMRDTYDVSPATRQKVLELASELHYQPNYNATGLARGSTHNIGVILPFITNYYFSTVITGIQEVAYSKGYNIVLFVTNDCPKTERSVIDNICLSGLDGLLVCVSSDTDSCEYFQDIIIDKKTPVVFFDRVVRRIKTSKVMQDDFNGAFEVVEHLIENGYDRIAHLTGPKGLMFTERRLQGYISALEKHHLPVKEEWIIHSGFSQESGEEDMRALLHCEERPNAVFAVNDRKAIGAMLTLKEKHIAIGTEIGMAGFTNDPLSALISPSLTTMAEPAFHVGQESCELLIKHIRKKNFIPEEKILSGKLIVRESSRRSCVDEQPITLPEIKSAVLPN